MAREDLDLLAVRAIRNGLAREVSHELADGFPREAWPKAPERAVAQSACIASGSVVEGEVKQIGQVLVEQSACLARDSVELVSGSGTCKGLN